MQRVRLNKAEKKDGSQPTQRGFYKGHPKWGGRKKGTPNKAPALLKEATLMAAELVGSDGKGKDGLVGYLKFIAQKHPASFTTLLNKILPMQLVGDKDRPISLEISADQIDKLPLDKLEVLRQVVRMIDQGGADAKQLEGLMPRRGDPEAFKQRLH